ncbi:MAG: NAD-dependent epimerase/dehydratase family protein [Candidatus Omnitrophica bacterium]|nr:NAD-dependent epimerase/dehydratase family protein [Candidatus Omnitrophota bacterium]
MAAILVTGGAGFIGSHVSDELIKKGHKVVAIDDLSGGFRENVSKDAVFLEGTVLDQVFIKYLFDRYQFDHVFHLAAYAAEGLSHFIKRFNYSNNLIGSVNLINASVIHKVKCFIFTSSIAVYGKNQLPMDENMVPRPEDPYGIAKYAVEQELRVSKEMFGLDYIVFRPHNVYGEKQNIGDKYRNVIGIFMNQIMLDKPMPIFGDGSQTRAFSYIADIAPLIAGSIEEPSARGEIFNIGAEKPYTVLELANTAAKAMGVRANIVHLKERSEVRHAYCDHSKARKFLGEHAATTLEDGIGRMAEWAKRVGPRKSKIFADIEITENLPESWAEDLC